MNTPEYRTIDAYPGYKFGNDGSVWSCRPCRGQTGWRRLKASPMQNGYPIVSLYGRIQRTVHSLVLEAFVGPSPAGMEVRHKNGNRGDARLDNLEYGTRKQNAKDKFRHGTNRAGEQITHFVRLKEADVLEIRRKNAAGQSMGSLGREYGVTVGNIHAIVHRKSWKHI